VRVRRSVGFAGGLCALAIGLVGWWSFVSKHSTIERAFPVLLMGLSAAGLCLAIRALWRPWRAVVIDREGITAWYPRSSRGLISWSEIRGAHLAWMDDVRYGYMGLYKTKRSWRILALELVDPARFQTRHDKRLYLGFSTGFVPDYFPIPYERLDIDGDKLLSIIREGIVRNGHPAPDPVPKTAYNQPTFL
jgi:hypothetical protein